MGFFISVGQITGNLFFLHGRRIRGKRKRHNLLIPKLFFHFGEINTPLIHSGRCACLESAQLNPHFLQGIRQMVCRMKSVRPCIGDGFPAETAGSEISSRTKNDSTAEIICPGKGFDALHFLPSVRFLLP